MNNSTVGLKIDGFFSLFLSTEYIFVGASINRILLIINNNLPQGTTESLSPIITVRFNKAYMPNRGSDNATKGEF